MAEERPLDMAEHARLIREKVRELSGLGPVVVREEDHGDCSVTS